MSRDQNDDFGPKFRLQDKVIMGRWAFVFEMFGLIGTCLGQVPLEILGHLLSGSIVFFTGLDAWLFPPAQDPPKED